MSLTVPRYAVLLAAPTEDDPDATVELETKVLAGDQFRAELEGPKYGLGNLGDAPMAYVGLWIWASLARQHLIEEPWPLFKPRLLTFKKLEAETPVDPTQPEASTGSG